MSARNGDKSRYQINRKRAILRRLKIRELVKSVKSGPAQTAKTVTK
jgi:HJR/Mrr/RecB family endonuclease